MLLRFVYVHARDSVIKSSITKSDGKSQGETWKARQVQLGAPLTAPQAQTVRQTHLMFALISPRSCLFSSHIICEGDEKCEREAERRKVACKLAFYYSQLSEPNLQA